MEMTRPLDTVHKTLGCVYLMCSTNEEPDHSMRRSTAISKKVNLTVGILFGMDRLEAI